MTDAVVKMAYSGSLPWHGKGSDLTAGADIDTWKREAGLDFTVVKVRSTYVDSQGNDRTFPDRFATIREDDGTPLGLVSDRYKLVQPGELIEFYRDFVAAGDMVLETAGTLLDSRRVWALARLDHEIVLPGNDISRPFFLLTGSFDGDTGTVGTFGCTRVVCANTLAMALTERVGDKKSKTITGFSLTHRSDFDRAEAQGHAKELMLAAEEYAEKAAVLASTGINSDQMLAYFVGLVGRENEKHEMTAQSKAKVDRLVQLYKSGPGADLPSARGTAFGALNAVTRFVDHEAPERGSGGGRLVSAWYGAGRDLKNRALEQALELAVAA